MDDESFQIGATETFYQPVNPSSRNR